MSLGYMDLISMAEANKESKQKELQRRQALLAKEKRMDPKQAKLKVGVQKFLAKKEEEERKRKEEELLKKRKLLELRNQDRKATSRVRKMINMTKSANKSVLAEADESLSEQVDAQADETQPDEDDYGYTSTYEQEMYKKMLEKYKADAKKNPKPDKDMINRPKIHHLKPSSTSKSDSSSQNGEKFDDNSKQPKKKPPPPPPPSFQELLEMAEKKSKEPVVIQKPMAPISLKDGPEHYDFGRPMTKREKAKYVAEQALKQRAAAMFSGNAPAKAALRSSDNAKPQQLQEKPKLKDFAPNNNHNKTINNSKTIPPSYLQPRPQISANNSKQREINNNNNNNSFSASEKKSKKPVVIQKPMAPVNLKDGPEHYDFGRPMAKQEKAKYVAEQGLKQRAATMFSGNAPAKSALKSSDNAKPQQLQEKPKFRDFAPNNNHNKTINNNKTLPPSHLQPRPQISANNSKQREINNNNNNNSFSTSGSQKQFSSKSKGVSSARMSPPPPRRKDPKAHKRPVIESDEEYDSEMDDFIDDTDIPGEDISSMIGQMFGYNKRKYVNEDSDDECMESSVEQQMREEARSLRIGVMEDLEDMRREEEENRRKALMMKKRKLNK